MRTSIEERFVPPLLSAARMDDVVVPALPLGVDRQVLTLERLQGLGWAHGSDT